MQRLLGRASDKLDIPVFRVGGGLKVFVSKSVALKVEYRYEQYTRESTSNYYYNSYTSTVTTNYHNVLFGFCVFFPAGG
jgi:opacity protein-like surface antigen